MEAQESRLLGQQKKLTSIREKIDLTFLGGALSKEAFLKRFLWKEISGIETRDGFIKT